MYGDDTTNNNIGGTSNNEPLLTPEQRVWREHVLTRYGEDAALVAAHAKTGIPDRALIERVLDLLRTYLAFPGVGLAPLPSDQQILELALVTVWRMRRLGYWREMDNLWPSLCTLTEFFGDAELYVTFVKYMANAKGYAGDREGEFTTYYNLINHAYFPQASATLQANVLMGYATALVWRGERDVAASFLQRSLVVTESVAPSIDVGRKIIEADELLQFGNTPLWESRAYTFNQLGVLSMFSGNFAAAYHNFAEMSVIFQQQGEEENRACIAHQAIGRLLLYEQEYTAALDLLTKGLTIRERWEDQEGIAVNSIYIAAAQIALQQFAIAETYLLRGFQICQEMDNRHDLALCHLYLGLLALRRRQMTQVAQHWQAMATIATHVILHFVEVRPLVAELPTLLRARHVVLTGHLLQMLWQSIRHDRLSLLALLRFAKS